MADALSRLAECAINGVIFPVETADTEGGQDTVEHTAYRRRGSDVEMTGQRAYSGTLRVPLINTAPLVARYGQLFPGKRFDLLSVLEAPRIVTLTHPTFGTFPAAIKSWKETAAPDNRDGVVFELQWVEHNGSASILLDDSDAPPTTTISSTADKASAADAAMATSGVTGYVPVASTINAKLNYLEAAPRSYTEVSDAFRQMLQPVLGNLAMPGFGEPGAYAALRALLDLQNDLYSLRSLYQPTADQLRFYRLPVDMALWEVSLSVYGSSAYTRLILGANAITQPLSIPAGTVLTILPLNPS